MNTEIQSLISKFEKKCDFIKLYDLAIKLGKLVPKNDADGFKTWRACKEAIEKNLSRDRIAEEEAIEKILTRDRISYERAHPDSSTCDRITSRILIYERFTPDILKSEGYVELKDYIEVIPSRLFGFNEFNELTGAYERTADDVNHKNVKVIITTGSHEIVFTNETNVGHFVTQLFRIPHIQSFELDLIRFLQIGYNLGQFIGYRQYPEMCDIQVPDVIAEKIISIFDNPETFVR